MDLLNGIICTYYNVHFTYDCRCVHVYVCVTLRVYVSVYVLPRDFSELIIIIYHARVNKFTG
jgi:hypothetical protein